MKFLFSIPLFIHFHFSNNLSDKMPKASKVVTSSKKNKVDLRSKLLKKADEVRASRPAVPEKTAEDYAKGRDLAFNALVDGDTNEDNCIGKNNRDDSFELNAVPMLKLMEASADEGRQSAFIYRWQWKKNPSDRTWTFNNVRLRDLLFRRPSDDAGFKDNDTLMEKLNEYVTKEYGEGFRIIFRQYGGKCINKREAERGAKPRYINQTFLLTVSWRDETEKKDTRRRVSTDESEDDESDSE